jgi:ethanolamine ammonia-lyase large subunit
MKTRYELRSSYTPAEQPVRTSAPAAATLPGLRRRTFLGGLLAGASVYALGCAGRPGSKTGAGAATGVSLPESQAGEDIFAFITRTRGSFDATLYRQILGAANEYKEGDDTLGVAARDAGSRQRARALLRETRIRDLVAHPVFEDQVYAFIQEAVDQAAYGRLADWRMGELARFLIDRPEAEIQAIMPGLPSDIIACAVKLMSNDELVAVGRKVFNPLPGSKIGAKGYLGARIQPNSPTDHPDDLQWQVFDGWAYAVGDVVLGVNPVSSEVESVAALERALHDIVTAFGLEDVIPHCVLAHVDVQAEAEKRAPGTTGLWFQSLAGVDDAGTVFDISVDKMRAHAAARTGKYGLYFETGQGADATNGHGKGFDMVMHESRNYGYARALKREVAEAQRKAGREVAPWVHLNDVAGFIGPEVFRTREQLVRCCLEDTVMGKLHGLPIGLDICSTLHMEVDLDDLDWCMDQIMPANPAYLMGLPTKNDPMLSYLTTAFQDHVRMREKFGYKVDDRMWRFFQELGVIDAQGKPTAHFGQPAWVYLQFRRKRGDRRPEAEILAEARQKIAEVRARGVFIAEGHGEQIWQLEPSLDERVRFLYEDAKKSIWAELPAGFAAGIPAAVSVSTQSKDRLDYILHPPTGEVLAGASQRQIEKLRDRQAGRYDVQIVISDGLNALSLTDEGHLGPFLEAVRKELGAAGYRLAPEHVVITGGRVRAGYRIGETLYGGLPERDATRAILHVIGERPGSGHRAYSVYMTAPPVSVWAQASVADHNITKVVSGIADTQLAPEQAARDVARILTLMAPRKVATRQAT